jgi:hypothetical protein
MDKLSGEPAPLSATTNLVRHPTGLLPSHSTADHRQAASVDGKRAHLFFGRGPKGHMGQATLPGQVEWLCGLKPTATMPFCIFPFELFKFNSN